ncbi:hypothetical protein OU798_20130 [Prolixibacteraceae bacterium Z1-6]|uniref:Uncharacterized protein n=1 Tax=Draconibacterium aestuarii TaxID=2998507 RepID=A0A9X3J6I0_9BACT|nr:hypothetical protein [Prolixibacteraceae bacterium Z1-6]
MKTNFIYNSIIIISVSLMLFLAAVLYGNSKLISMTMAWLGCALGGVIGVWIRKKKNIKTDPVLQKELLVFFLLALVLSGIWYIISNTDSIQWIGIAVIFLISLIVFSIKNKIWRNV